MAGPITQSRFEMIDGTDRDVLFEDKMMFAVTFTLDS